MSPLQPALNRQFERRARQLRGRVGRARLRGVAALGRAVRFGQRLLPGAARKLARDLAETLEAFGAPPSAQLPGSFDDLRDVAFLWAANALGERQPEKALAIAGVILRASFRDKKALLLRARCRAALGDFEAALADVTLVTRPSVDRRAVVKEHRAWYELARWGSDSRAHDVRVPPRRRLELLQPSLGALATTEWLETEEARAAGVLWSELYQKYCARAGAGDFGAVRGACAEARRLLEDARYREASEVLRAILKEPGGLEPEVVTLLARAERAQSRYRAARNLLTFARRDRKGTSEALVQEAEIAWIEHDYAEGEHLARRAHDLGASQRALGVLARCATPLTRLPELPSDSSGHVLSHAAFFTSRGGNFGDIALPIAVREAVARDLPVAGWLPVHVHQCFDEERLELVNSTSGILIGGGGLFLPDTSPNGSSGWQWNITTTMLERVRVPLALFAVGYNLFPGQEFQGSSFRRSIEALAERAVFVGLRNHGSIEKVRALLPARLAEKVRYVPCPTTILRHIHPGSGSEESTTGGPVLFNAAFDRSSRRFGDTYPRFLTQLYDCIELLHKRGIEVRYASHMPSDERFTHDLRRQFSLELPIDRLYDLDLEDAYECYRRASVVVGMRGHASMIPFGLGTPILSLVSHPKLRYFLEDIGRPEWALDVSAADLGSVLYERTCHVVDHEAELRQDVAELQSGLSEVIRGEVARFSAAL